MTSYHHWASIDTADGSMPMYVAVPGGGEPRPSVLVIHGIDGLAGGTTSVVDQFAEQGYVAAAPDLFHRGPVCATFEDQFNRRRAHQDTQTTVDIDAAIGYLRDQPFVHAEAMGIIGFCMGGRVAYYMAGTNPIFAVAADCYGGGVFVSEGGPAPIEFTSKIRCPMLILDGEKDRNPSPEDVRKIGAELKKNGITHEVHLFPGVGHGFMGERPNSARDEAYQKVWDWFHMYLETTPNTYVEARISPPTR